MALPGRDCDTPICDTRGAEGAPRIHELARGHGDHEVGKSRARDREHCAAELLKLSKRMVSEQVASDLRLRDDSLPAQHMLAEEVRAVASDRPWAPMSCAVPVENCEADRLEQLREVVNKLSVRSRLGHAVSGGFLADRLLPRDRQPSLNLARLACAVPHDLRGAVTAPAARRLR